MIKAHEVELNAGHFIEITNTAHIVESIFESQIVEHPAVCQTPALAEAASNVSKVLQDFYQMAAEAGFNFKG